MACSTNTSFVQRKFRLEKAMVQRRVVVPAKQGKEDLKPMEVPLTGEILTQHIFK